MAALVTSAVLFDFKDTLAFVAADGPTIEELAAAGGYVPVETHHE